MRSGESKALLSNASATGNAVRIDGGIYVMAAEATFGGGSVALHAKLPNGTYGVVANGSLTANGMTGPLYLPAGEYKAAVATATGVYASLYRVG